MVSYCANPGCSKPLHYLRDGRIYVFDASVANTRPGHKRERRLEHYWLCGACVQTLILVQDALGWIKILPRPTAIVSSEDEAVPTRTHLAS